MGETMRTQLAWVLAHFRMLVLSDIDQLGCVATQVPPSRTPSRSFAEWKLECADGGSADGECWPDGAEHRCFKRLCPHLLPITRDNELMALSLFRSTIVAHLKLNYRISRRIEDSKFSK